MILKNSLYTIQSKDEAVPAYHIALQAGHTIYQAHFPGEPITPGVCIVQIAVELLGDHCRQPLRLVAAKNVKFMAVISPVETPEVDFVFDKILEQPDGNVKAQVTIAAGEQELTKISMTVASSPLTPHL